LVLVVISPLLLDPVVRAALRDTFERNGRMVEVPRAVGESAAEVLRRKATPRLRPFEIADRGRYDEAAADEPELLAELVSLAGELAREPLRVAGARWLRFHPGSYALLKDSRGAGEQAIEVTLDASAEESARAAVVYRRADSQSWFDHQPLSLLVFDRRPLGFRYDQYLPLTAGPAEVWRLRLTLQP
jgi:hypothetical protein